MYITVECVLRSLGETVLGSVVKSVLDNVGAVILVIFVEIVC